MVSFFTKKMSLFAVSADIYLYRLVVILQSHNAIHKQKWMYPWGGITSSATIQNPTPLTNWNGILRKHVSTYHLTSFLF